MHSRMKPLLSIDVGWNKTVVEFRCTLEVEKSHCLDVLLLNKAFVEFRCALG